jgi:flavin-dependent dehydrogenase
MGTYDAIVVGLRAAGAATAMLLARAGLGVLGIDRGRYGGDTLSTHALMRGGVLQLSRWGLLPAIQAANTPPISSTTFHYGQRSVRIAIKPRDGVPSLFAPRRYLLDRLLVDAADAAGAEMRHGWTVVGLTRDSNNRVDGVVVRDESGQSRRIRSRVVIGADGMRSTIARLAKAAVYQRGQHATGVLYGYWPAIPVDGNQWYWMENAAVGAIPTNNEQTCIFVAVPDSQFPDLVRGDMMANYRRLLEGAAPSLAAAIAQQETPKLRGFGGERGFFRRSAGPGWALVGDAGYFKDPLTAHGITDALRDAEWLSRAVVAGSDRALTEYEHTRDLASQDLFEITDQVASFTWTLATLPELHERLSNAMRHETDAIRTLDDWARSEELSVASGGTS